MVTEDARHEQSHREEELRETDSNNRVKKKRKRQRERERKTVVVRMERRLGHLGFVQTSRKYEVHRRLRSQL